MMVHQLYGSQFNEHKKLITFSDSVQDAAHRASFYCRTWPLMIRGKSPGFLANKRHLPLDAFAARVCQRTRERSPDDAHLQRTSSHQICSG
ncbi:hypothetical protein ACVXHB_30285 [Escherichia coli]